MLHESAPGVANDGHTGGVTVNVAYEAVDCPFGGIVILNPHTPVE